MSNQLDDWIQNLSKFPPKSGILFYDISPIIEQPDRLRHSPVCELIRDSVAEWKPDLLAGIDSRGFLLQPHRSPHDGSWRDHGAKEGQTPRGRSRRVLRQLWSMGI